MTDTDTAADTDTRTGTSPEATRGAAGDATGEAAVGLAELVGDWLDAAACAAELGIPVSRVRVLVNEHRLAATVPTPGAGHQVPAAFLDGREIVKGIPGVLTVLHDGGYDDRQIITWLFTDDPTLPGRPVDALRENRGAEVKRRAQAMAF